jgi:hypothetical protein
MPTALTINDHQIADRSSFAAVTGRGREVAGIYFFYKLDCLVDLAYLVAHDLFARPELFTRLPDGDGGSIAPVLARLHARYGNDERFLDMHQRAALFAALFGRSAISATAEEGSFPNLRDELLAACATFVETKFGDEGSLRENVRQQHRLFKEYLVGLAGDSVVWSRDDALDPLAEAVTYPILRNGGVSAIYGIATPPRAEWPYTFDSNADKLVEEISKQLGTADHNGGMGADGQPKRHVFISREEITNRQRVAIEGANAIATIIDVDGTSSDADIDLLIRKCYTWATALRALTLRSPSSAEPPAVGSAINRSQSELSVARPAVGSFAAIDGR